MEAQFNVSESMKICFLLEQGKSIEDVAKEFHMSAKDFLEIAVLDMPCESGECD